MTKIALRHGTIIGDIEACVMTAINLRLYNLSLVESHRDHHRFSIHINRLHRLTEKMLSSLPPPQGQKTSKRSTWTEKSVVEKKVCHLCY